MSYVEAHLVVVPKKKLRSFKRLSAMVGKVFMMSGALQYIECAGDNLEVAGLPLSFPKLQKLKKGEISVLTVIFFKSRAHRDAVDRKVQAHMLKLEPPKSLPFDGKRLAIGGFVPMVKY